MTSSYRQTSYPRPPFISLTNQNGAFLKTRLPLTNERTGFASFTYNANLPLTCPSKNHRKVTSYTTFKISHNKHVFKVLVLIFVNKTTLFPTLEKKKKKKKKERKKEKTLSSLGHKTWEL